MQTAGKQYTRQGLFSLFLICAFPVHLWAIILILRDVPWVIERTNVWDAIGVGSYGMIWAFLESAALFLFMMLLGFFTPASWGVKKRVSFLALLVLLLSAWGMLAQLVFIWNLNLPSSAIRFLAESGHPVRIMYAAALAIAVPSIAVPVYLFLRREMMSRSIQRFIEQISLLAAAYLFLDLICLVIVVIRNWGTAA